MASPAIPNHEPHPQSPKKLSTAAYEAELRRLQSELVNMQEWIRRAGRRLVVIFEGRDAAGKGSAIARITQYLNPRYCRVAALPKPTPREQGQWYFQRHIAHLPSAGEITIFDRSWYNRAGVERVMGFATQEQYKLFLRQVPVFENLLIEDGIMLRKYWFSVSDVEQEKRFRSRFDDPLRRWKLSPMDMAAITRWEDYSRAKDDMFLATDTVTSPWFTVESEDKKRSRINVIAHLLSSVPYEHLEPEPLAIPERPPRMNYYRPPRDQENHYVPDVAAALERSGGARKKDSAKRS
ncbi:MAG: polyphosphate kinase 2 [Bifidobacteriaceae bacterium]|jgi:polyphosphate kinase 2|nr:polyphosphate kinase 2 [Bifidobacteriaceae bacterium]